MIAQEPSEGWEQYVASLDLHGSPIDPPIPRPDPDFEATIALNEQVGAGRAKAPTECSGCGKYIVNGAWFEYEIATRVTGTFVYTLRYNCDTCGSTTENTAEGDPIPLSIDKDPVQSFIEYHVGY